MKLDDVAMLRLMKEEYDKRINSYLGEIEVKASYSKSDSELVDNAKGLKVKNRAGFVFTIVKVVNESGGIYVYLSPPGEGIDYEDQVSGGNDYEKKEKEDFRDDYIVGDENEEEEFIYSAVTEDEDRHVDHGKNGDKMDDARKSEKSGEKKKDSAGEKGFDLIKPSDKAKFKKQMKIDVSAGLEEYEEVNGLVRITLKQLEDDFTL